MYELESVFTLDQLVLLGLEKLARNLAAPSHVYLFGPSVVQYCTRLVVDVDSACVSISCTSFWGLEYTGITALNSL